MSEPTIAERLSEWRRELQYDGINAMPLINAVEKVLALHVPTMGMGYYPDDGGSYGTMSSVCAECGTAAEYGVPWPCPTVAALAEALEATHD